jgi:NitT/TauT family transport system permease protein
MNKRRLNNALFSVLIIIGYFVAWEFLVIIFNIKEYVLPKPHDIYKEIALNSGYFISQSWSSLYVILSGIILSLVFGFLLGFLLNESKLLNKLLSPLISSSQTIPKTALIPLFIAWHFGYGDFTKIFITFLISFYPIFREICLAYERLEEGYLLLFKSFGASRAKIILFLKLPFSIPYILSGLKMASLYAVIGAVTSEIIFGVKGIGYVINISSESFNTTKVFAGIVIATIIGSAIYGIVVLIELLFVQKKWNYKV